MTVDEIKHSAVEIKGTHNTSDYELDADQSKNILSTLNTDVFTYYDLNEKYSTPLQQEVFKKTDEYKTKEQDLKKVRQDLLAKPYYIDFAMSYYEQHNIEYNTATHSFDFDIDNEHSTFYDQNYMQFGLIVISKPKDILLSNRQFEAGGMDYVRQTIKLVISDMNQALTIENNREHLRILFVFNFTGLKSFKHDIIGMQVSDYFMLTKLDKVILYNVTTGEIYHTYLPSAQPVQKQPSHSKK